jgi:hypothetical protein
MKRVILGSLALAGVLIGCGGSDAEAPRVSLVKLEAAPSCAGGTAVSSGVDEDGNGVLDPAEVDATQTICEPASEATHVEDEPKGPNCAEGGVRITTGSATRYVCNGAVGASGSKGAALAIRQAAVSPGEQCAFGGTRIEMGADDGQPSGTAADGVLQDGEVDQANVVCDAIGEAYVFTHTATAQNKLSANGTDVDNPACNNDPNAFLVVTPLLAANIVYDNSPLGVYYNATRKKWEIFNQNNVAIPNGAIFNVLVVKRSS